MTHFPWLALLGIETHQAGGLQPRGGSVDSSHSWHRLIVVDEPLGADQQFWCIRYQILFAEDKTYKLESDLESFQPTLNMSVFPNPNLHNMFVENVFN